MVRGGDQLRPRSRERWARNLTRLVLMPYMKPTLRSVPSGSTESRFDAGQERVVRGLNTTRRRDQVRPPSPVWER
jgi:hypothetical protein